MRHTTFPESRAKTLDCNLIGILKEAAQMLECVLPDSPPWHALLACPVSVIAILLSSSTVEFTLVY